jgi:hypothetical protein
MVTSEILDLWLAAAFNPETPARTGWMRLNNTLLTDQSRITNKLTTWEGEATAMHTILLV